MAKYIALYLAEAPALFAELAQASDGLEPAQVAAAAHNLRPMMHQMGAQRLMDLLSTIEERASAGEAAGVALLVQDALMMSTAVNEELHVVHTRLSAS